MRAINFGIDLGTTNSLITKFENGTVVVYKNPIGHKETLASVVAFRQDRILVGDKAREYLMKDPVNVFGSFKRKMGTDEKYYVVNIDENVTPVELSSYVLKELKQFVHSNEALEAAVITIPASFDTMQSNATKKAGIMAGLQEVFLLQEPIAASLAYFNSSAHKEEKNGHWLVYDLGGGTFDVALVNITDGEMKVADHEGNNFLGGVDFDLLLVEKIVIPHIVEKTGLQNFKEELSTTYGKYEKLYFQLLYKAEEAKKELSNQERTEIEFTATIEDKNYDFVVEISKQKFNEIIDARINETIDMLQAILQRNSLQASDIEQIILVGGSTLIPYVREQLVAKTEISINTNADPTTAVAIGASYYAANKYYEPSSNSNIQVGENTDAILDTISNEMANELATDVKIEISYSKTSREEEELLLIKSSGDFLECSYRITRNDGGYDSGIIKLKSKFTEFLPLLHSVTNTFYIKILDAQGNEIKHLAQEIKITHGQYNIVGQPLPRDICIEIDDKENNTTKLEMVFEKNSILPQKKMIYRTIAKTIKKDSDEKIVINILEGDRYSRAISNTAIGCIEISGKELNSDLIKGSDIEIKLTMSESRELRIEAFLVMTQQEFKNVFSISEKQISLLRLREQFNDLENDLRESIKLFNFNESEQWAYNTNSLLEELLVYKTDLFTLKEKDKSDKKYIIADAVCRISQQFDKVGGDDRLDELRSYYFEAKEFVENHLPMLDFEKEKMNNKFQKLVQNENQLLRTRNSSILEKATERMNELGWDIVHNTTSYLISRFEMYKEYPESVYKNYSAAKSVIKMAEKALEQEKFAEFRQHFYNLTHLVHYEKSYNETKDFKGTGIG